MKNNAGLLRGLQYFETVARHNSVKSAARELGVTASAVSRQLRELTASLGEQLVVRAGRGIALTPTGRQLANKLAEAFANLEHSILGVVGAPRPQLRLAVCTSFGPGWLAGRLSDFYRVNPDINIELRLLARTVAAL
ncbi:MAG: LysR family transcriptional regulator [Phyllobacteriaceae bacterium]|nr:LysR family transcriptional regulator [Phyllobacteriaceae bacterium]